MNKQDMIEKLVGDFNMVEDEVKDLTCKDLKQLLADKKSEAETAQAEHVKATYNCNEMYDALRFAHKSGNKHAITKGEADTVGVGAGYWALWCKSVENLRQAVVDYLTLRESETADEASIDAARETIFPLWKSVLEGGEEDKFGRTLHVLPKFDIETLVGFGFTFVHAEGFGTQMAGETEQLFRKKVESLIGCRMHGCSMLNDADRDAITDYQSAMARVESLSTRVSDLDTEVKQLQAFLDEIPADNKAFRSYVGKELKELRESLAAAEKSLTTAKSDKDSSKDAAEAAYAKLTKLGE